METDTTVEIDSTNSALTIVMTVAATALCAVVGWKAAGWTRSKLNARKVEIPVITDETD